MNILKVLERRARNYQVSIAIRAVVYCDSGVYLDEKFCMKIASRTPNLLVSPAISCLSKAAILKGEEIKSVFTLIDKMVKINKKEAVHLYRQVFGDQECLKYGFNIKQIDWS